MKTVMTVYENGVFRPVEPVDLPEHTTVLVPLEGAVAAANGHHEEPGAPAGHSLDPWPKNALTGAQLAELVEGLGPVTCFPEDAVAWQRQMRDEEWPDPVFPEGWLQGPDDETADGTLNNPNPASGEG